MIGWIYLLQSSERTLDAPDILDDYYLNLLDWGSSNVLSIALGSTVYLWDAADGSTSELVTVDEESGPVTSVKWAPDGRHVAIGLNNSEVQLWDSTANRLVSVPFMCLYLSQLFRALFQIFIAESLISAAENIEGRSLIPSWCFGLEQSHLDNRRNGWSDHQQ